MLGRLKMYLFEQNLVGKIPIGRLRCKDVVKRDLEALGGMDWKELATAMGGWRLGYETGWS